MLRTITDVSLTIFVWYMMADQLYKTLRREAEAYQWRKKFRANALYGRFRTLDAVSPYPETWIARCPDCNMVWPVRSKECPTFLEHGVSGNFRCPGTHKRAERVMLNTPEALIELESSHG